MEVEFVMRYRVKFQKYGVMKFVGHLDIMRYFQKAFRRAALPIRYSEGFNPHQIMSFAAPLGVGITSDGEYMDVDMKEEVLSEDTLQKLDSVMVDGMKILEFRALNDSAKKAMTAVRAASYLLYYKEDIFLSKEDLQSKLWQVPSRGESGRVLLLADAPLSSAPSLAVSAGPGPAPGRGRLRGEGWYLGKLIGAGRRRPRC